VRAAVLGKPIRHSLSPALHRAAYAALGLDWSYDAIELADDELAAFLDGLDDGWAGLSLTMPLKQAVLPLLDDISDLARDVAAANTVVFGPHGRRHGHNTDVHGIVAALAEAGITDVRNAVILGGGATARSALAALAQLGERRPTLVVRSHPAETLAAAERLGVTPRVTGLEPAVFDGCDLVISTLPAGAADGVAELAADIPALVDVVYEAWPTPLAQACRGVVVSGAQMLLHQAAAQVEFMTRRPAPLDAMRAALPAA
jgi:shikimate dehydrogenase